VSGLVRDLLKISEIFCSIQGEASFAGWPCTFIRVAGCPLRCVWCDTPYAYDEGEEMDLGGILQRVLSFTTQHVELTGGEPLAQAGSLILLEALCDQGKTVLLETSGAFDISGVDPRAHVILDVKCPSSGMTSRMGWENLDRLSGKDDVKFVIANRPDYDFAREVISRHGLTRRCTVFLSPAWGWIEPREIARWMLEDKLAARLQLQLQKHLWPPDRRGV
jgi:7-carboxy-7-deazaguanine synthase